MTREELLKKNKRMKEVIRLDSRLYDACDALRQKVEDALSGPELMVVGSIFHKKDEKAVETVHVDGVEIGYRIMKSSPLEVNPYFDQEVFLKTPGYKLDELSEREMAAIQFTIATVFFRVQQQIPEPDISPNHETMRWRQRFEVALPYKFQDATIQVSRGLPNA